MNRPRFLSLLVALTSGTFLALLAGVIRRVTRKPSTAPSMNLEKNPEDCSFGSDSGLFERLAAA